MDCVFKTYLPFIHPLRGIQIQTFPKSIPLFIAALLHLLSASSNIVASFSTASILLGHIRIVTK
jgi:hypothetical protein